MPWGDGFLPLTLAALDPGFVIAALFLLGLGIISTLQIRYGRRMERMSRDLSDLLGRVEEALEGMDRSLHAGVWERPGELLEEMGRRLARIEERLDRTEEATQARTPLPPETGMGIREVVESRLAAEGFRDLRLPPELSGIEGAGEFRIPLEAYRDGVAYKGEIVVRNGRVVEERIRPSYEAFP